MKTTIAFAFILLASPSLALAERVFDPTDGDFLTVPDVVNPANAAAAAADVQRPRVTIRVFDPTEGEFTSLGIVPDSVNAAAAAADAARYSDAIRVWDPAEGDFVSVSVPRY
jgi:hypothetical protein